MKQALNTQIEFPDDFMFELNNQEFMGLRSQFATSNKGGTRYKPFAFTEQGVAMLSSVLNSPKAIEINIQIIRAFVFLRQYALTHKDLTEKLKEPESHFDKKFKDVYEAINYLLQKDTMKTEQIERKRIGYKTKE
jgi:phage regulator Rha-like protein